MISTHRLCWHTWCSVGLCFLLTVYIGTLGVCCYGFVARRTQTFAFIAQCPTLTLVWAGTPRLAYAPWNMRCEIWSIHVKEQHRYLDYWADLSQVCTQFFLLCLIHAIYNFKWVDIMYFCQSEGIYNRDTHTTPSKGLETIKLVMEVSRVKWMTAKWITT